MIFIFNKFIPTSFRSNYAISFCCYCMALCVYVFMCTFLCILVIFFCNFYVVVYGWGFCQVKLKC